MNPETECCRGQPEKSKRSQLRIRGGRKIGVEDSREGNGGGEDFKIKDIRTGVGKLGTKGRKRLGGKMRV